MTCALGFMLMRFAYLAKDLAMHAVPPASGEGCAMESLLKHSAPQTLCSADGRHCIQLEYPTARLSVHLIGAKSFHARGSDGALRYILKPSTYIRCVTSPHPLDFYGTRRCIASCAGKACLIRLQESIIRARCIDSNLHAIMPTFEFLRGCVMAQGPMNTL